MSLIHPRQPLMKPGINVSVLVQSSVYFTKGSTFIGSIKIHGGQERICDSRRYIGNVLEDIPEWRYRKLIVHGEGTLVDVKALRPGVGDDQTRSGCTRVIDIQSNGGGL